MRLTKKAVGSWLGLFPGRRVSLLHSGQGKGWLGPPALRASFSMHPLQ